MGLSHPRDSSGGGKKNNYQLKAAVEVAAAEATAAAATVADGDSVDVGSGDDDDSDDSDGNGDGDSGDDISNSSPHAWPVGKNRVPK